MCFAIEPLSRENQRMQQFKISLEPLRMIILKAASIIFYCVLLLAVVDYGTVQSISRAVISLAIAALFGVSMLIIGLPRHTINAFRLAIFLFLATAFYVFLQTTEIIHILPIHPAWEAIKPYVDQPVEGVASITPADDRAALLTVAMPLGFFMTGLMLFQTDEQAEKAFRGMAIAGGLIALWSLGQFFLFPDTLVFGEKRFYKGSLTGFFVNRNTAATFFGVITVALFSLWWNTASKVDLVLFREVMGSRKISQRSRRKLIDLTAFSVLLLASSTALMLTQSRAGIGASFLGLMFYAIAAAVLSNRQSGRSFKSARFNWKRLALVLATTIGVAFFFLAFAGRAILRAEVQGLEDGRFCIMPGVWAAIRDNFPWGTGLASFPLAYSPYHKAACGVDVTFYRAHNVYAEGLLTLGAAFPVLAAVFISSLMYIFIQGVRRRRQYRFAGLVGLANMIILLIHSALDFSIQIPGFAISFACVTAPLVTLCMRPPGGGGSRRTTTPPS